MSERHKARQRHVTQGELERLRVPTYRVESLRYGPKELSVCLYCGRIKRNLGHHLPGCPVMPGSLDAYNERWGFPPPSLRRKASQRQYYRQHSAELKDRAKKWHAASQPRVSGEELERLRIPENLLESLRYGPDEKTVCLECGRIGDNLSRHTRGCPAKPQSSSAYKQRWGFDRSNPLTSPKQREAYSQSQRRSATFDRRREGARKQLPTARAARTGASRGPMSLESKLRRRGKRTGARPHRQKIPDSKVLEILAFNLPIAEAARRAGISQTAFYRRAQRLGWDAEPAKEQRNKILERVFELRTWLFSQAQLPAVGGITQRYMNELRLGTLQHSPELTSFVRDLAAELTAHPEAIGELAGEKGKLASSALSLASRIFKRARTMRGDGAVKLKSSMGQKPRKHGPDKQPAEQSVWFDIGRKVEELISKGEALIDARRQIAGRYEYETVVRYHRKYRGWLRNSPVNPG
jgi:predicted transcriptional regulator